MPGLLNIYMIVSSNNGGIALPPEFCHVYGSYSPPGIIESVPPERESEPLNLVVSPKQIVSDVIIAVGLQATDINLDAVSIQFGD